MTILNIKYSDFTQFSSSRDLLALFLKQMLMKCNCFYIILYRDIFQSYQNFDCVFRIIFKKKRLFVNLYVCFHDSLTKKIYKFFYLLSRLDYIQFTIKVFNVIVGSLDKPQCEFGAPSTKFMVLCPFAQRVTYRSSTCLKF